MPLPSVQHPQGMPLKPIIVLRFPFAPARGQPDQFWTRAVSQYASSGLIYRVFHAARAVRKCAAAVVVHVPKGRRVSAASRPHLGAQAVPPRWIPSLLASRMSLRTVLTIAGSGAPPRSSCDSETLSLLSSLAP